MIADLKPYPEYKESGLPWIGQIPSHWDLVPNRGLVRRRKMLVGERHTEYRLLSLTKQGVIVRDISTGKGKFSSDMGTSQEVRTGDFVFCLFDVPETPRTVGLSRHNGMITGAYTVFESTGRANPQYVELFYLAMDDRKLLSPLYSGLRNTIPVGRLLGTKTPQPPADEQDLIVRFLGWANGRLERAIRAKRRVIVLLNEQKQAIIHRAVTRGLDPSVSLKPSGISWLGDIPQHWHSRRLKHCITPVEQGWSPQCDAQPAGQNEWGVLKVGCVNKDTFAPEQNKKLPHWLTPDETLEIRDGDILVSRANTRELLGLAALAEAPPTKRILCDKLFRFRAKIEYFNSKFLVLFLRSKPSRAQIESSTNGASSSMQNIGQGVLKNLWISMPPVAEQDRIVAYVTSETAPLHSATARLEHEIDLLREYRTRLIADVVTGKLDVRDAATRLPDAVQPGIPEVDEAELDSEEADEEVVA